MPYTGTYTLAVYDFLGMGPGPKVPCDIDISGIAGCVITVAIDVKPGSGPNSINVGSRGVIPVAILTSDPKRRRCKTDSGIILSLATICSRNLGPVRIAGPTVTDFQADFSGNHLPRIRPPANPPRCAKLSTYGVRNPVAIEYAVHTANTTAIRMLRR